MRSYQPYINDLLPRGLGWDEKKEGYHPEKRTTPDYIIEISLCYKFCILCLAFDTYKSDCCVFLCVLLTLLSHSALCVQSLYVSLPWYVPLGSLFVPFCFSCNNLQGRLPHFGINKQIIHEDLITDLK